MLWRKADSPDVRTHIVSQIYLLTAMCTYIGPFGSLMQNTTQYHTDFRRNGLEVAGFNILHANMLKNAVNIDKIL